MALLVILYLIATIILFVGGLAAELARDRRCSSPVSRIGLLGKERGAIAIPPVRGDIPWIHRDIVHGGRELRVSENILDCEWIGPAEDHVRRRRSDHPLALPAAGEGRRGR